jgi:hypothetical protein
MSRHVVVQFNRMPAIADAMRAEASRVVRETAYTIEADIKTQMTAGKSGRTYGDHVASAPGEAPAVDTGALINSIQTDAKPMSLTATVYTPMDYAPHLEYGTVHMAARPSFTPAAERARAPFVARMRAMLGRLR